MSDQSSASITIGGRLARSYLPALLAAIASDHVGIGYGDRIIEDKDIERGVPLRGYAVQVTGAEFPEVEAFCRARGLRYIRQSDACPGAWEPSLAVYPGVGPVCDFSANADAAVVVTLAEIRALGTLAAIEAHFEAASIETGPLIIVEAGPPA